MALNTHNIDSIIQFSLLAAGEEDDFVDRQLGPIHLIKYVYLADLHFSQSNNGRIFTGVDWRFYNFGPWSEVVHSRIDPALRAIRANQKKFPSDYGEDDWVRWEIRNDRLYQEKYGQLPFIVAGKLRREIHEFGTNTPALLDYTYKTKPMIEAAPNEHLDFSHEVDSDIEGTEEPITLRTENLSNKKGKKFKSEITSLRSNFQEHKKKKSSIKLINPVVRPRFDDIYQSGVEWLETLEEKRFSSENITVEFDADVWKSGTRKGNDVPR